MDLAVGVGSARSITRSRFPLERCWRYHPTSMKGPSRMLPVHWREKRSGVIGPEERLPWGGTLALGFQHVLAMFGATVVAPLIMGFDPNLAILFSGGGTLIFLVV